MGIQVKELTEYKDPHEKEFIDFYFDGKYISEFNMVAAFSGDRHNFDASPQFEDETSVVNGADGQYFWGTHFSTMRKSFFLATDGMTEREIDEFKAHFIPGRYGMFYEDKLVGRYSYARVCEVTTFNVIPFRETTSFGGAEIPINIYKGDCTITFEFDDPYFYSTSNVLLTKGMEQQSLSLDLSSSVFQSVEEAKMVYNNQIPLDTSWQGTSKLCVGDSHYSLINGASEYDIYFYSSNIVNYYNPSTGPAKPIITIQATPTPKTTSSSLSTPAYFKEIADDINNVGNGTNYNSIILGTQVDAIAPNPQFSMYADYTEFQYSSPDLIYSINRAIQIAYNFYNENSTGSELELEEKLRLEIVNDEVMGWAAAVLRIMKTKVYYNSTSGCFTTSTIAVPATFYSTSSSTINAKWWQYFNIFMLCMLGNCTDTANYHIENGNWSGYLSYTLVFNSVTCSSKITYSRNQILTSSTLSKITNQEKSCGDSIRSKYLILDGGDKLTDDLRIWKYHQLAFRCGNNTYLPEFFKMTYDYTYL